MSVVLFWFLVNRHGYSSNYWNLLHVWLRDWIISLNFYLIESWLLNMMNIVLLIVFLNNRLSNSFLSWNGNSLKFLYIVNITISGQRFQLYLFVFSLFYFQINLLSINNRLQISFFDHSLSRSLNSFNSFMFSYISISVNWSQINHLFWFWDKFKFFPLIYYFLFNDRLVKDFSLRSFEILYYDFLRVLNWVCFFGIFKFLCLLLLNINKLLLNILNWLNVFFSICYLSGNFDRYFINNFFIVYNRLILNCLCVNRSCYFFFPNNWCLHYSLLDNWLSNDSLCNYRLADNASFNWRLTNNLLTLSNLRSWIKNLVSQLGKNSCLSYLSALGHLRHSSLTFLLPGHHHLSFRSGSVLLIHLSFHRNRWIHIKRRKFNVF